MAETLIPALLVLPALTVVGVLVAGVIARLPTVAVIAAIISAMHWAGF